MRVVHAGGLEGARSARGTVVVIDVLRAFTVSAYALAGGAAAGRGLPVPGIAISNSPTMIRDLDLRGRVLVQRSSSGTQCVLAAGRAERLYAAGLVVARATVTAIREAGPGGGTLVAL